MQLWTLAAAAARHLVWALPSAARQMHMWRARAQAAIDAPIHQDALDVFARKRTHSDGAGPFWTLHRRRTPALLRLLIAYQPMVDFLGYASERGVRASSYGGARIHAALIDAIDLGTALSDHYRHHPGVRTPATCVRTCSPAASGSRSCPPYPGRSRSRCSKRSAARRCSMPTTVSIHMVRDERLRRWADVVLVERLREVSALRGFTRLSAPDDIGRQPGRIVRLAREEPRWLPCSEVRGEGIFIRLPEDAVREWEARYLASEAARALR